MRLVVQRVRSASVKADGREIAHIDAGLVVFVGFSSNETSGPQLRRASKQLVNLRIFDDVNGRLNRSLQDIKGELLLIPQITLTANLDKGTRPSFHTAAQALHAKPLFEDLVGCAKSIYPRVSAGIFQTHMLITLENDGPATFVLDYSRLCESQI